MIDNIEVLFHSSIRIRSSAGVIYIDPYKIDKAYNDADYIFITHDHYDHYSVEDIKKVVGEKTVFVVPEKMGKTVVSDCTGHGEIRTVSPGKEYIVNNIEFETVAAYNLFKPFHPKMAGWCGYILIIDGKRIYVAGDTDATKEAKQVVCDIALVPVGGTYTMDAKQAAELVNEIRPKIAVPTHYGSVVGKQDDAQIFAKHVDTAISVEIRELY